MARAEGDWFLQGDALLFNTLYDYEWTSFAVRRRHLHIHPRFRVGCNKRTL